MKNKYEIVNELEGHVLSRFEEIERINQEIADIKSAINILNIGSNNRQIPPKPKNELPEMYKDYNLRDSLLNKYRYFENIYQRFWKRADADKFITEIEGPKKGAKTIKNSYSLISKLVSRGELIQIKYLNNTRYSFYTTNREWVETTETGHYRIASGHEPDASMIANLSEDQLHSDNITWNGII